MNEKPEQLEEFVPENLRDAQRPLPKSRPANIGLLVVLVVLVAGGLVAGFLQVAGFVSEVPALVGEFIGFLVLIVIAVPIYFLPCLVAGTKHRNFAGIAVLNLFLGWTLVGWVAALIWALYREKGRE